MSRLIKNLLGLVIFLALAAFAVYRVFFEPTPPPPTNEAGEVQPRYTIQEKVSRVTSRIVVRLPVSSGESYEQINVIQRATGEFKVSRASLNDDGIFSDHFSWRDVTSTEWEALDALRERWCADRPTFRELEKDEQFYEVAMKCGDGPRTVSARVPVDQLSPELAALIESIPSRVPQ
jgi:hypothetical protein